MLYKFIMETTLYFYWDDSKTWLEMIYLNFYYMLLKNVSCISKEQFLTVKKKIFAPAICLLCAIFPQKEQAAKVTHVITDFCVHIIFKAVRDKVFTKILSEQKIYFTMEKFSTNKKRTFVFASNSLFVSFKFGM